MDRTYKLDYSNPIVLAADNNMGASKDELSNRLKETTEKLASLTTKQTEFEKHTQQYTQELVAARNALTAGNPAIKKSSAPTLKTHTSEAITQWYRAQLQSIIQAGKQHDKTAEVAVMLPKNNIY